MKESQTELEKILDSAPYDNIIAESIIITHSKLGRYDKIVCSISGGSDSDILLIDLLQKYKDSSKITYVFFVSTQT